MVKPSTTQRWCAALSYLIFGLLWYAFDSSIKHTVFLKFHVRQSVIFLLGLVIVQVLAELFAFIPFLWSVLALFLLFVGIAGILHALRGEKKELPLIGKLVKYLEV